MAIVINLPKFSDTMEEGGISSWQKKVSLLQKETFF